MAFALLAVATLMLPSLAVGYASATSYTATTVCTGNTITAEYAVIEYYKFNNNSNYSLVTDNAFSHGCLQYTTSGSGNNIRYRIAAISDLVVSIPNLNLKIDKAGQYEISTEVTVSGGNVTVNNFRLFINNTEAPDGTVINGNTYYPIKLKCSVAAYDANRTAPVMPTFNVSVSAVSLCSSVIVNTNNSFDFMSISQQAVDDMAADNGATPQGTDTYPSYYDAESGERYYFVPDNSTTDGVAGVYITSGDKSTNINGGNNDTFATTLTIPNDKMYLIKVYIKPAGGISTASGEIKVKLTEGEDDYESDDVSQSAFIAGSAKTYYLYKSGNKLAQYDATDSGSTIPSNLWMSETTEQLELRVTGSSTYSGLFNWSNTEIKLELLFKDPN